MTTDYEQSGIPKDPARVRVDRMEEALDVIEGLFADGAVRLRRRALQHHRPRRPAQAGAATAPPVPDRRRRQAGAVDRGPARPTSSASTSRRDGRGRRRVGRHGHGAGAPTRSWPGYATRRATATTTSRSTAAVRGAPGRRSGDLRSRCWPACSASTRGRPRGSPRAGGHHRRDVRGAAAAARALGHLVRRLPGRRHGPLAPVVAKLAGT